MNIHKIVDDTFHAVLEQLKNGVDIPCINSKNLCVYINRDCSTEVIIGFNYTPIDNITIVRVATEAQALVVRARLECVFVQDGYLASNDMSVNHAPAVSTL